MKKNPIKYLSKIKNNEVLFLTGLFIAALVVRLIYLWQYSHAPDFSNPSGDAGLFCSKALEILRSGNLFGNDVPFQSPAYPMFLALFFKLAGSNYFLPRLIQVLIGSVNCLVVYTLAKKASPTKVWPARIAGIMTAFYGTLVFFEGDLLMISLTLFFVNISFLGLILYREKQQLRWPFIAGICFAVGALDRTNMLVFAPMAIWFLWKSTFYKNRRIQFQSTALYLTGIILVILPFTIHNYRVSGDMVLISSNAGINLYIGNNPYAQGVFAIPPDIAVRNDNYKMAEDAKEVACKECGKQLKPSEVSRFWTSKAVDFIVKNPVAAAKLYAKKIRLMFNQREIPNHLDVVFFKKEVTPWLSYLIIGFWIVAPLAFAGILIRLLLGMTAAHKLYISFIIVYTVSLLPFFINDRYRLPIVPFLIIFTAFGIAELPSLIQRKMWKFLSAQTIAFLVVYLFVTQIVASGLIKYSRLVMAEKYAQRAFSVNKVDAADLDKAITQYSLVIEAAPYYPAPYVQLAGLYEKIGWYSGAKFLLEALKNMAADTQSVKIEEDIDRLNRLYEQSGDKINGDEFSTTDFELAIDASSNGNYVAAENLFRKVIKRDVEHIGAWVNLSRLYLSKRDTSRAIRTLEMAWKKNPQELFMLKELLNMYKSVGNLEKYRKAGKKLKEFSPVSNR